MLLRKCIVVCSIVFVSMIYNDGTAIENTVKEKKSEIKSLKGSSDVIASRIEKLENQNSYNTFLANEGAVDSSKCYRNIYPPFVPSVVIFRAISCHPHHPK